MRDPSSGTTDRMSPTGARPLLAPSRRVAVFLGKLVVVAVGFVALGASGVINCFESKSVGPASPPPPTFVTAFLIDPASGRTAPVGSTITFTVTAVDESKQPVRNSQNGIRVGVPPDFIDFLQVTDEPDPDNARIRVTVQPPRPTNLLIIVSYTNPDEYQVHREVRASFTHNAGKLIADPGGPISLQVGETRAIQLHVLTAGNQAVPGGDRWPTLSRTFKDTEGSAEWRPGPGEPSGDHVLAGSIMGLSPASRDFTFDIFNPDLAANVAVTIVQPRVAELRMEPAGPIVLAPGQESTVRITAVDAGGNPVLAADGDGTDRFPTRITASSNHPSVVKVVSVNRGAPLDGAVDVKLRGEASGQGEILLGHPDLPNGDLLHVQVVGPPPGHVVSVTSQDAIHVGVTWDFEALTYDPQFQDLIPGDEFVTATSSDPAVATIEAKIDDVPNDGRVKFRVKGRSVGQTTITYHYPGGPNGADTTDTTILTVNP